MVRQAFQNKIIIRKVPEQKFFQVWSALTETKYLILFANGIWQPWRILQRHNRSLFD